MKGIARPAATGDAQSDAVQATVALSPNLAYIVEVWAELPDPIRQAVLALIATVRPPKSGGLT